MKVYRNPIRIGRNETVDGEKSSASVDPVVLLADGSQTSILTINVKNEFDKAIEGLASEDFVILGLQNAQAANFQNLGNGEYSFDITDQTAEGITLTIVVDGVEIADKPQIVFEQAANPTNSSATANPDDLAADGVKISTLSIVVRDYEDNPITGLTVSDFVITDYGDAVINNFQALNNGEYSFDISNTTVEIIILTIEVVGVEIDDQPEITFSSSNVIYFESFEDDNGGYITSSILNPLWEWGEPSSLVSSAGDGNNCWATNLDGNYPIIAFEVLHSIPIDLTGVSSGTTLILSWMQACSIESGWDDAVMQYSIDGVSWTTIWSHTGTDMNTWHELSTNISSAAGHNLLLRWILSSDFSITEAGYYIDKIQIIAGS